MLFQVIKTSLAQIAEYNKHNMFLMQGFLALKQDGKRLSIRHSKLQTAFIVIMTALFGPGFGAALASGKLDMADAPVWAWGVAVLVPLAMTAWLIQALRTQVFTTSECVLDGYAKRIQLRNPATREHYPGKKWPGSIPAAGIHHVEIRTQSDSESGEVYILDVYLSEDDFLILLATQSAKKMERIAHFLRDEMGIEPAGQ